MSCNRSTKAVGKLSLLTLSVLIAALLQSSAALAEKSPQEQEDERMARAILSAIRAQAQGDPEPSAQTKKQKRVWPKHESAEPPPPTAVADPPPVILPYTPGPPPPDAVPAPPPVI